MNNNFSNRHNKEGDSKIKQEITQVQGVSRGHNIYDPDSFIFSEQTLESVTVYVLINSSCH